MSVHVFDLPRLAAVRRRRYSTISLPDVNKNDNNDDVTLIFLYNPGSGGQTAAKSKQEFERFSKYVYNLKELQSSESLINQLGQTIVNNDNVIISIAGGDGSQMWGINLVTQAFNTSALSSHTKFPIIIPLPAGTGNDLARSLGWGNKDRTLKKVIKHVSDIHLSYHNNRFNNLDIWKIQYTLFNDIDNTSAIDYINSFHPPLPHNFTCYLSIGYDAHTAWQVENDRKKNKEKYSHQGSNIRQYWKFGAPAFFKPSHPITQKLNIKIDGKTCILPKKTRSFKLININSAADGVFFWGDLSKKSSKIWKEAKLDDGLIEVVTTTGARELVRHKFRDSIDMPSHANRLAQAQNVVIEIIETPTYLQIDGESYKIDKKCSIEISFERKLPTLIGCKAPRGVERRLSTPIQGKKIRRKHRKRIKAKYEAKEEMGSSSLSVNAFNNNDEIINDIEDALSSEVNASIFSECNDKELLNEENAIDTNTSSVLSNLSVNNEIGDEITPITLDE